MADVNGTGLKEAEQMDWDNYNPGSKYVRPPVPILNETTADGRPRLRTFYGQVGGVKVDEKPDREGFRQYLIDPIKVTKSGADADGYEIRFSRASIRKFRNQKTGEPINASMVGNILKGAAVTAKPQRNADYDAAMNLVKGRIVPFTADWSAYDKETGESVDGYTNFPDDPERPGQKLAILKAGDTYLDKDGAKQTVKAEVMFANLRVKFFLDPNKGRKTT